MIKKLIHRFKKRSERKLRMWCIEKAISDSHCYPKSLTDIAEELYKWVIDRH